MEVLITSPEKFADWFNRKVPGAYRWITGTDVRRWQKLGLIQRNNYYYTDDDLRAAISLLQLEKESREERYEDMVNPRPCKGCGQPLVIETGKRGRPKEYCTTCEPKRGGWRNRKSRIRRLQKTLQKV